MIFGIYNADEMKVAGKWEKNVENCNFRKVVVSEPCSDDGDYIKLGAVTMAEPINQQNLADCG